jgi:hypothetical protein
MPLLKHENSEFNKLCEQHNDLLNELVRIASDPHAGADELLKAKKSCEDNFALGLARNPADGDMMIPAEEVRLLVNNHMARSARFKLHWEEAEAQLEALIGLLSRKSSKGKT